MWIAAKTRQCWRAATFSQIPELIAFFCVLFFVFMCVFGWWCCFVVFVIDEQPNQTSLVGWSDMIHVT